LPYRVTFSAQFFAVTKFFRVAIVVVVVVEEAV
jgi:hypothetical protein